MARVAPSWLAYPILLAPVGSFGQAVGAFTHEEAIIRLRAFDGPLVMATFDIEAGGQWAGAVRVVVAGEIIASIRADSIEEWTEVINSTEGQTTGWVELEVGNRTNVWLRCVPQLRQSDAPFLPPFTGWPLTLNERGTAFFDAKLNSRAKTKRMVVPGEVHDRRDTVGGWWVQVDNAIIPLGVIDDAGVKLAQDAGFPLTCSVLIRRKPDRPLSVEAFLP